MKVVGQENISSFLVDAVGDEKSTLTEAKERIFTEGGFKLYGGALSFELFYSLAEDIRDLISTEAKLWPTKREYLRETYKEKPTLRIYLGEEYISLRPRNSLHDTPKPTTSTQYERTDSYLINNLYFFPRNFWRLMYSSDEIPNDDSFEDKFIDLLKKESSEEDDINYARLFNMYEICYKYASNSRLPLRAYFVHNEQYIKRLELPHTVRYSDNDSVFCGKIVLKNDSCYCEFSYENRNRAFDLSGTKWCAAYREFDKIKSLCIKPFIFWVIHYIKTQGVGYSIDAKTEIASKIKSAVNVEAELEDGSGHALVYGGGVYPSMYWVIKDTYTALFRVLTRLGVLKHESCGVFKVINTRKIPTTTIGAIDVYSILEQCEECLKSENAKNSAKSAA